MPESLKGSHTFASHIMLRIDRAFTLIELLVVVMILTVLMAIVMPSLRGAVDTAKSISCQSNMRQIQMAWMMFVLDHHQRMPIGVPGGAHGTEHEYFVTNGNRYYDIAAGSLYPYLGSMDRQTMADMDQAARETVLAEDNAVELFKCAADANPNKRTYSCIGPLRGENWDNTLYSGTPQSGTDRFMALLNPANQMVFVEEADYRREYNVGSWLMRVDEGGKWRWIDYVAPFHTDRTSQNFVFADGHVETWRWLDQATLYAAEYGFSYAGQGYTSTHSPPFFQVDTTKGEDWARARAAYRQLPDDPDNNIRYYANGDAIQ